MLASTQLGNISFVVFLHFDGSVATFVIGNEVDCLHEVISSLEVKRVDNILEKMDPRQQFFWVVGLQQGVVDIDNLFAVIVSYNLDLVKGVLVVGNILSSVACQLNRVVAEENRA